MKKLLFIVTISLLLAGFGGCSKNNNQSTEQPEGTYQVNFNDITSGEISQDYKYSDPDQYDIYNPENPFYYDKSNNQYKCSLNNEIAEVTQISPEPGTATAGPSRISYYCPQENVYWIRDFPGYGKATVYGPFAGQPQ